MEGREVAEIGSLVDGLLAAGRRDGPAPRLPLATAVSALEQALWDLRGQQVGLPIHALLGGARRRSIPLYANINRGLTERTPEAFGRRAAEALAAGFEAVKCAPFDDLRPGGQARPEGRPALELGIARIESAREALGPGPALMVDCHERFDPATAVEVARRLEPTRLRWFEEPVPMYAPGVLARCLAEGFGELGEVGRQIPFALTAGEKLYGLEQFGRLFETARPAYTMPDVKHCGGIWELLRIGTLAEAEGIAMSPHNPGSAVATLVSAHLAAALPCFDLLEFQWGELDWRAELIEPAERVIVGMLEVPERPGLGARLNERVAERYRIEFD
jgi:galactonate dehydratase